MLLSLLLTSDKKRYWLVFWLWKCESLCATENCFRISLFLLNKHNVSSEINISEKVFQFADDTPIICSGNESSLHEKRLTETGKTCRDEKTNLEHKQNRVHFSREKIPSLFPYSNEVLTTRKCCRSTQVDRKLNFDGPQNKKLYKYGLCYTISSPNKMLKSSEFAQCSLKIAYIFRLIFCGNLFFKFIWKNSNGNNRQINWVIKVYSLRKKYDRVGDLIIQTKIFLAELTKTKMLLINFHWNIAKPEDFTDIWAFI